MIKSVVFDMFETLVTPYRSELYFGEHIAKDLNISEEDFRDIWDKTNNERTIGKLTFEDAIQIIMRSYGIYSQEVLTKIVEKRIRCKQQVFTTYSDEVISMLEELKNRNVKIALISNCYSEEVDVIKESSLYSFFDVAMLSYEQGIKKPDLEIYQRTLQKLNVKASECLYVGDGGSHELDAAFESGMKPLQAKWYLKENTRLKRDFSTKYTGLEKPSDLFDFLP